MSDPKPEWHDAETRMGDVGATAVRSPSSSSSAVPSPVPGPPSQGTIGGGSFFSAPLFAMGTVLANRYEILQVLGQGGMGAVYKVYDRELERFVALKTIRPELAGNAEMLARFKQELILARQVAHRNIVRLYDIAEGNGVKFITMEYVEGEDFRGILRREDKLSTEESINVIRQICFALQAAHAEGVIHRDLKPQNIMRDKQGRVVVMDFGLARALESDGMTQTGALLGTMEYMSPEQSRGEHVDCTSDIYAAGLIFYELLTGKMPYAAESALASLMKRAQQRAIPASEIDRGVPRNLSSIVSHCIEPDKKKRYQSASEILVDLEAADPTAKTSVSFVLPRRAAHTSPIYKWIALALIVLVIGIGAFFGWKKLSTPKIVSYAPMSVLVADFENHTGDPLFDGTLEPMVNVALEGAKFINAYNRGTARNQAAKLPQANGKLDEQSARLVALSQGISAVVTGQVSRRGDKYDISAMAMDSASGNVIATSEVMVGDKNEVLRDVPKLVAPLRNSLGDATPASQQLVAAGGAFTAASLEVVHQYGVGMEEQFAGKTDDALRSFEKAAELDPTFARAYAGLSSAALKMGRPQDAEKYIGLAMQHVDHMTDREQFRVRGFYYLATENWQKCSDEYTKLGDRYPGDNISHNNLAVCLSKLRNFAGAAAEARKGDQIRPNAITAANISLFSSYSGDFNGGEQEAVEIRQKYPTFEFGYLALAFAQVGQGHLPAAEETYRAVEKVGPVGAALASWGLADMESYEGRYSEASKVLEAGIAADLAAQNSDDAAEKLVCLATNQLWLGQTKLALSTADKALANSQSVKVKFLAGQLFARAGQNAKAAQLSKSLASDLRAEPQAYSKTIDGDIALKAGDFRSAVQSFTAANKLFDTWIGHRELGQAYLQGKQWVEADAEFETCLKRRGEALSLFLDQVPTYGYLPAVYYYQGLAREGMKSPGAADSFRTYLNLRGQTGEDPLLADVRKRVGN
jgi:tetratricopeptide (TPR) repeat protein/predicted Ser/Thr protein kinase